MHNRLRRLSFTRKLGLQSQEIRSLRKLFQNVLIRLEESVFLVSNEESTVWNRNRLWIIILIIMRIINLARSFSLLFPFPSVLLSRDFKLKICEFSTGTSWVIHRRIYIPNEMSIDFISGYDMTIDKKLDTGTFF
jgi:hypothetical protein